MLGDKSPALGGLEMGAPPRNQRPRSQGSGWLRWGLTIGLTLLAVAAIFADTLLAGVGRDYLIQRFQTFVTIFLGIFIEAVPFLLAGSIVSGLIAVFVDQSMVDRYLPKRALPAVLSGALMGLLFPVCECGVVPVTRRFMRRGCPCPLAWPFCWRSLWSTLSSSSAPMPPLAGADSVGLAYQFGKKPKDVHTHQDHSHDEAGDEHEHTHDHGHDHGHAGHSHALSWGGIALVAPP